MPAAATETSVAYLVAAYPAVSHTFIAREIDALRRRGVSISTISIRRTPATQLLTDADRAAAAETFTVLPVNPVTLVAAHLIALRSRPAQYFSTLLQSLTMSSGGARATLWQLFYFAEAIIVWHRCRRQGIRHIHAHFANVACAVALLAARFGEPDDMSWSFTMHGPTEFDDVTRFALAEKVRRAAFVACISDFCRSQLMKLTSPAEWDRLHVVRCGLSQSIAPGSSETTEGPLRVLCVGRLVPEKGQLILLRAAAMLRDRGVAVRLTIVGDGPLAEDIRQQIDSLRLGDAVELLGALGADQVGELYSQVDAFCLPSFAEGVPVVLMEAMAAGLPVVSTRIAGISELVEDGVSGALVPPGRPAPVAEALACLAGDRELRERWGRAGRERVTRAFDVDRGAEILQSLFAQPEPPSIHCEV